MAEVPADESPEPPTRHLTRGTGPGTAPNPAESGCSAYECELVVLAEYLDVPLISAGPRLAQWFA
jgi:hypothetical protein